MSVGFASKGQRKNTLLNLPVIVRVKYNLPKRLDCRIMAMTIGASGMPSAMAITASRKIRGTDMQTLPDWRPRMTPDCLREELPTAKPTMMVTFRKKVCYVPVTGGPDGLDKFTKYIREKFGLKDDANINVSFGCREPLSGTYLKLEGHGAFNAAVHCASISAASRERVKYGHPPVENATYNSPGSSRQ